ncbi:MAG: DUF2292 domain-containing protein [Patescibacteria group bacterium]
MAKKTPQLLSEINEALDDIRWGSIEVFVQNDEVTQITVKNIKKTGLPRMENETATGTKSKTRVLTNKKQKYINGYNRID